MLLELGGELVGQFKKDTFESACELSLDVVNKRGANIARLVPIGSWALDDNELVASFCDWRRIFMKFFLVQFEASEGSTRWYLENLTIAKDDRLLFAIYVQGNLTGHLGLSSITNRSAEADNILRGKSGGGSDLMLLCELALLDWAFKILDLDKVHTRIISKNVLSQNLFYQLGFRLKRKVPLRKIVTPGQTKFEECFLKDATEKFTSNLLEVERSDFELALREHKLTP